MHNKILYKQFCCLVLCANSDIYSIQHNTGRFCSNHPLYHCIPTRYHPICLCNPSPLALFNMSNLNGEGLVIEASLDRDKFIFQTSPLLVELHDRILAMFGEDGSTLQDEVEPIMPKQTPRVYKHINPQSCLRRSSLWKLTSVPSSDPEGVVSSEPEAAGVATDFFSSAGLVSDGKGTPNASSTCVLWTWHRQQLKFTVDFSHLHYIL